MRAISQIIIHCSATFPGQKVTREMIESWHKARGFNEIGYHYLIDIDGTIIKGRDLDKPGAHCKGQNLDSVGICYIGGLDSHGKPSNTLNSEQKASLLCLIDSLRFVLRSYLSVHGHNEYDKKKACPCFDVLEVLYPELDTKIPW